MANELRIPAPLRRLTGGARSVTVAGEHVAELLADAVRQHPELGGRLFTADGTLRADARLFIDGDEPDGDPLAAPVAPGQVLTILPPIAGA